MDFGGEGRVLSYLFSFLGGGRVRMHGNMFGLLPFLCQGMRWCCLEVKGKKKRQRKKGKEKSDLKKEKRKKEKYYLFSSEVGAHSEPVQPESSEC